MTQETKPDRPKAFVQERLSNRLTLAEFTFTRHVEFMEEQAAIPPEAVVAGRRLAFECYDRAWNILGRLIPTSGYRCPLLNEAVGGSPKSAHMFGRAIDFIPVEFSIGDAMYQLARSSIPFDKAIIEKPAEHGPAWLHLQVARNGDIPRRLTFQFFGRYYEPYDERDPRVLALGGLHHG